MVIAMIVGGSAVIAMSSTFLNDLLGIPQLGGALIMAVICIVLVLWGAGLVRSASSLMSVVMIAGLVILAVLIISERSKELGTIVSTWYAPEKNSFWIGLPGAVALGLSNCCNALTLSAVEQKVSRTRDCAAIGIISFVMNSTAFIITTLMLLPYCPEVLTNTIPILSIIHQHLLTDVPWASDSLYNRYAARARLKRRSSAPRGRFAPAGRLSRAHQEPDRKKYDLRYHLFYRMYPYFIFGAFQYRQHGLFHSGLMPRSRFLPFRSASYGRPFGTAAKRKDFRPKPEARNLKHLKYSFASACAEAMILHPHERPADEFRWFLHVPPAFAVFFSFQSNCIFLSDMLE